MSKIPYANYFRHIYDERDCEIFSLFFSFSLVSKGQILFVHLSDKVVRSSVSYTFHNGANSVSTFFLNSASVLFTYMKDIQIFQFSFEQRIPIFQGMFEA